VIACPACGQENPDGFRFCGSCGAELAGEPAASREVRKTVTVLFCDLAGYTRKGERLDPEALRRVQSRYFDEARAALERHGGTVEKFIGDAVMAVFGIPQVHEDDALRALRAAVELREVVSALELEARIGVNTGEVVAGSGDALVTGDAVNVAARLEQAASPGEILIGEQTLRLTRGAVEAETIEPLELKGKTEPVTAFRLVSSTGATAIERRLDAPLVGRAHELELLRQSYAKAVTERACRLVTVTAPPGIGKSRLALELAGRIESEATVLIGHCLPYGEGITYWPLVEIFRAARAEEELDAALAAPGAEETFLLIRKLLERLARERPLVLIVDDIHWAELTLLDLLEHLTDWTRDAPILLLCLARPDLVDRRPAWSGGRENADVLTLQPLSDSESDQLIETLLGGSSLADDARERVRAAAEGNPLFVEQLLAMLAEGGSPEHVPPTIQALLTARLDALPVDELELVERASVVGLGFEWDSLAALSARGRRPAGTQLAALVRKELIRPHDTIEDAFSFRHALIRDAAYERLSKGARAAMHERLGDWLDGRSDEFEELVGYHFEQASRYSAELGETDEAAEVGRRAAERLSSAGSRAFGADMPAAANLLARAAALLPEQDPVRLRILPELGIALIQTGEFARAADVLDEAIAAGRSQGDAHIEYSALTQRTLLQAHVDPEHASKAGRKDVQEAIRVLSELEDHRALARAWYVAATLAHWSGQAAEAEVACERAFMHASGVGDRRLVADALWRLCTALALGPTPAPEAERRIGDLVGRARGDRKVEAVSLGTRAPLVAMQGRFDEARALRDQALALNEELGLRLYVASISHYTGFVEVLAGDLAAAEAEHRASAELLRAMGATGYLSATLSFLAEIVYSQGRLDEACELSEEAEALGPANVLSRSVRAQVLARRGEHAAAEALARDACALVDTTDHPDERAAARRALAEVLRLAGRPAEATAEAEIALGLYEQKGNQVMAEWMRALLAELQVAT
jgi:class 3 adenylate cyclase/tetratricopeptide (TPR) repeat protein